MAKKIIEVGNLKYEMVDLPPQCQAAVLQHILHKTLLPKLRKQAA